MDATAVLIIILVLLVVNFFLVKHFGHHFPTMIIGVAGFAFIYIYSFWYMDEMTLPAFALAVFFFFFFVFGRIKHQLQKRRAQEEETS